MTKLDWDREAREARKRKHGWIPAWADPARVDPSTRRRLLDLTEPLRRVVDTFDALDDMNKILSARETRARLRRVERAAVAKTGGDDRSDELARMIHDWQMAADEHVRKAAEKARRSFAR